MPTLAKYSQHLARLIPAIGSADFPDMLVQMMEELVPCEDATIVLFPGTDLPVIEYFRVPEEGGDTLVAYMQPPQS